jgi:hypothetical protein
MKATAAGIAIIAIVFGVLIVDPSRFIEHEVVPPDDVVRRASAYEGTWRLSRNGEHVATLRIRAVYDRIAGAHRGLVRDALACRNGWHIPLTVDGFVTGSAGLYLSTQGLQDAITFEGIDLRVEFPRTMTWGYGIGFYELERVDTLTARR